MAYANVRNSGKLTTSGGGGVSWTPGVAPAQNNLLTGRFGNFSTAPANGDCKDSSGTPKTFTQDVSRQDGSTTGEYVSIHSLLVPSGLTSPLKNANASSFIVGQFDEWSGNATSSILDTSNSNAGASGTTGDSGAINTGANAGLILAVLNDDSGGGGLQTSTGTSFTQDIADAVDLEVSCAWRTATPASQSGLKETWTWASNSTSWGACIASYNASSAAAVTLPLLPPLTQVRFVR